MKIRPLRSLIEGHKPLTVAGTAAVTEAAATLIDDVGFENLSMGLVAERLGVKTPSLYKHVTSQADLAHRIAVLAMGELADTIRDATQGRSGKEALVAGAQAMDLEAQAFQARD